MILTPLITAPIESFLQLVQKELGLSIHNGCLESLTLCDAQFSPCYTVRAYAGSQFYQQAQSENAIAIQYLGMLGSEHSGGSALKKHQIKLISSGMDMNNVICNRDYAVMAIEFGLKNQELSFSGYSWTGIYARIGNPAAQYIEQNHLWIATSSLIIGLEKNGCCL